ncbi:hypothetical protein [Photobacterium lipolyticum]|uniref:Uncharacterized protein n=1 Tax=Photobacterium lipolyticum TaxID=266810 RepID=A0A2T3MQQ0_9GAMM|nr:hypothetical protein [Photobacterium lipolyticum]PSV99573.1 hypothetical protein C9I89_21725 [Photobacterium lipolyticum]
MNYEVPEEEEFFIRGFGYSQEYDHDEGLFSFIKSYGHDEYLVFTHSPMGQGSVTVKLVVKGQEVFRVYKERISQISFQTWSGQKVIRIYFSEPCDSRDFLVYYEPRPRLVCVEL